MTTTSPRTRGGLSPRNIAAAGDEYMPGPDEFQALSELERAGFAEMATLVHRSRQRTGSPRKDGSGLKRPVVWQEPATTISNRLPDTHREDQEQT